MHQLPEVIKQGNDGEKLVWLHIYENGPGPYAAEAVGSALGRNARATGRTLADLVKKQWLKILPSTTGTGHRPAVAYEALVPAGRPITPVHEPHYMLRVLVQVHADATPDMVEQAVSTLAHLGFGHQDLTRGALTIDRDGLTLREALHFKHMVFLATGQISGITGTLTFYGEIFDRHRYPGDVDATHAMERRINGQYQYEGQTLGVQRLPGLTYYRNSITLLHHAPADSTVVLDLNAEICLPFLQQYVHPMPSKAPATYLAPSGIEEGHWVHLTDPTSGEHTPLLIPADQVPSAVTLGAQALFQRLQAQQLPNIFTL
ncbi:MULTISPECIES: hypothetical protein [unclassified Deinococcus]|uniref:hypothetical protein n=1 Tax=unclassified Deinococcus TaxID=2623546 RepID=UPI001C2F1C53|nr:MULTISPECIES: hypothetical protein [unclassified Deinococcus]MDK2014594.1 hypothetical protein [Deinococcus sp. 43]